MLIAANTVSHIAAHVAIFTGYLVAMILVPSALGALMKLSPATMVGGAGFFLTCGLTHLGLALERPYSTWVSINDHLQAGFILTFVVCLVIDLRRTAKRIRAALTAVAARYDESTARDVERLLERAVRE